MAQPVPPPPPPPAEPTPTPAPEPPAEPIPDTEAVVAPPPEPEKKEFRYRAQPARRRETPTSTTSSPPSVWTQPAAPQPAPRRPGFISQVKQAIGVSDADGPSPAAATSPTPAAPAAATTPPTSAAAPQAQPTPAQPASVRPQATQPAAVRPQAGQPASRQPAAVKPGVQQKRRVAPPKPPDEPEYKPGDLVCGNCGTGNDPARRFCRRCGTTLVDAIVATKPPWYRRIFRRRDRALKAGERPKDMGVTERRGRFSWVRGLLRVKRLFAMLVVLGAAVGIGAYSFLPDVRGQVNAGIEEVRRMLMPQMVLIAPVTWDADSVEGQPDDFAFDAGRNTYWAFDRADGEPVLTVDFDEKFDLGVVILTSGPKDIRTRFDRPKTVELTFPDSSARPIILQLDDLDTAITKGGLDAGGVETIQFHFIDFYGHDQNGEAVLAISDLQFQARR